MTMLGELMKLGRAGLGDGGGLPNDDVSYTGETGDSAFSMDYYRNKAREFQVLLNALDAGYLAAWEAMSHEISDDSVVADLSALIDQFEAKKTALKLTAEAVNAGAALINSAGGRFPVLSIPGTLGNPVVIPVGVVVALAGIATLAVWGRAWLDTLSTVIKRWQLADWLTPEERARAAAAELAADSAARQMDQGIFGSAAGAIKWIAIGALGFFAWQMYSRRR
jgi:hypothetical protein